MRLFVMLGCPFLVAPAMRTETVKREQRASVKLSVRFSVVLLHQKTHCLVGFFIPENGSLCKLDIIIAPK